MGNCCSSPADSTDIQLDSFWPVQERRAEKFLPKDHRCNFTNYHFSINVGGRVHTVFHPENNCDSRNWEKDQHYQEEDFLLGLQQLRACVKEANKRKQQIRAVGSGWSLSNIAYVNGVMVDCVGNFNVPNEDDRDFSKGLNYCKVGIDDMSLVMDGYQDSADFLCFVQSGVQVKYLNEALAAKGLVLPTQGASDGQTFIGAVSTGTHGSALQVGSIQDCVKGIHLVLLREHVYIQRASDKVVTESFAQWLDNARIIEDDDMFNAALVSFGSFGLIHGLLLEAEKSYRLRASYFQKDYDDVKDILSSLDVAKLGLPGVDSLPFHFEISINPYRTKVGEKGAFIRVLQKDESKLDPESEEFSDDKGNLWTETHSLSVMGIIKLLENKGIISQDEAISSKMFRKASAYFSSITKRRIVMEKRLYGDILQHILYTHFKIGQLPPSDSWPPKPPNEIFRSGASTQRYTGQGMFLPSTSMEVCVPSSLATKAAEKLLELFQQYPLGALMAFRYVKKSTATLAHTHFDNEYSTTIEICGAMTEWYPFNNTGQIHALIYDQLKDFSPSYHWGQQQPRGSEWLTKSYGKSVIANWVKQREKLLHTPHVRWMFSNDTIMERGLSDRPWRHNKDLVELPFEGIAKGAKRALDFLKGHYNP